LSKNSKIVQDIKRLNIPIMAFIGTNDQIEGIDYIIPANIQSWKGGLFVFNIFYNVLSSAGRNKVC
jgi:ribosomal protein S2